jgi:hypothetical protein
MAILKGILPWVATVPTLLLWGDRDRAVDPASALQLQRVLRHSELHILRGGGHIVFEELPEESDRLMLEWLQRDHGAGLATGAVYNATRPTARRKRQATATAAKTSAAL